MPDLSAGTTTAARAHPRDRSNTYILVTLFTANQLDLLHLGLSMNLTTGHDTGNGGGAGGEI